jgi:hypothetical protein
MTPSLKPFLIVAGAGALLSVMSLVIWLSVNSQDADVAFGRITDVATTSIAIADRNGEITTVHLAPTTPLWRGKQQLEHSVLRAGDFVQIVGERTGRSAMDGHAVRIMQAPPNE